MYKFEKKKPVWYVQWFYDFVSLMVLTMMFAGVGYATLHAIVKTQENADFKRGVECSVYWQDGKCGPQLAGRAPAIE